MNILHIVGIITASVIFTCDGKIFERCELARELRDSYVPYEQIGVYVCIAERLSNLNTDAVGQGTYFGMFQISSDFWCENGYYAGKACSVQCSSLTDDDIADDLKCVQTIYDEHQRLFNNGFNAWPSAQYCQPQGNSLIQDCFNVENQIVDYKPVAGVVSQEKVSGNVDEGKVYERCELARELLYQHQIPMEEIATWTCIAKHESAFNTSAIGRLNWDGSEDHGLFQISDIYWCGESGKACGVKCSELRDNDISNDVNCIKQIHAEHTRLSGDGFNAWAVYPRCKGQSTEYINGCFDNSDNELMPFVPKPGVQQPVSNRIDSSSQKKTFGKKAEIGKVYERCELARELLNQHDIPMKEIATWVCIVKHESGFNTSAIGRLNWDGSEDHGLFQISDIYWCGESGKACGVKCSELRDNDISNDVNCIKQIHAEHTRLSGDGFNAWAVYPRCKGQLSEYIKGCFDDDSNEILPFRPNPGVQQPQKNYVQTSQQRKQFNKNVQTGKIYQRCELAQELRFKHKIPMEDVATWVCIANYESGFNTSAIGRLNADGSEDHGLFQISDIYWCSPPGSGIGCGLTCSELEDNDITNDVECMLKIYDEHQLIAGDGFTAWTVYRPHCQGRSAGFIDRCFGESDENNVISPRPAVTQRQFRYETTTVSETTTTVPETTTRYQEPKTISVVQTSSRPSKTVITRPYQERVNTKTMSLSTKSITKSSTFKPITTTMKYSSDTTSNKPSKSSRIVTTTLKSTTQNIYEKSPTTAKFNLFDFYFNSISKGSSNNNEIKTQQKSSIETTTAKRTTRASSTAKITKQARIYDREVKLSRGFGVQETEKSLTKSTSIDVKNTSTTTSKKFLTNNRAEATTTLRSAQKTSTIVQARDKTVQTQRKPFNVFDFYLKGFTSKAPINYRPVKFSDRSTVIIGRSADKPVTSSIFPSTVSKFFNPIVTEPRREIKIEPQKASSTTTVRSLSVYNAFQDYSVNSNRIGRVVPNITPHSIDYLLTLTTPRTAFGARKFQ